MSSNKTSQSSGVNKAKRTKAGDRKKKLNPDKLLSDIHQQTEALNKIIKKFSEPQPENEKPVKMKNKVKSKNK